MATAWPVDCAAVAAGVGAGAAAAAGEGDGLLAAAGEELVGVLLLLSAAPIMPMTSQTPMTARMMLRLRCRLRGRPERCERWAAGCCG